VQAIGYAVGSAGAMLRTTNAGASWTSLLSGTGNDLTAVYFTSNSTGYAVGLGGTILRTTNGTSAVGVNAVSQPIGFSLEQNYPNPFNPATHVGFRIPARPSGGADFGFVSLKVYDVLGREVAKLVEEVKDAGEYSLRFDASSLPSGTYFYTLTSGSFSQTKRMLLLK
jgi:hypothetical protein